MCLIHKLGLCRARALLTRFKTRDKQKNSCPLATSILLQRSRKYALSAWDIKAEVNWKNSGEAHGNSENLRASLSCSQNSRAFTNVSTNMPTDSFRIIKISRKTGEDNSQICHDFQAFKCHLDVCKLRQSTVATTLCCNIMSESNVWQTWNTKRPAFNTFNKKGKLAKYWPTYWIP